MSVLCLDGNLNVQIPLYAASPPGNGTLPERKVVDGPNWGMLRRGTDEAARQHRNARFGIGDRDARVSADGGEHGLPLGWCRCDVPTIRHEALGKPISQMVGGIAETRASAGVQYKNRPNRQNRVNYFPERQSWTAVEAAVALRSGR